MIAVRICLFFALYLTIWAQSDTLQQLLQLIASLLIALSAMAALMFGKVTKIPVTQFERVMFSLGCLSVVTSALSGAVFALAYSINFLAILGAFAIIVRRMNIPQLLNFFAVVVLAMIATTLALDGADFLTALSVYSDNHGLFRFTPFGVHPNLTGLVYGGISLALSAKALVSRNWIFRAFYFMVAFVALTFVLAASARAALLALAVIALIGMAIHSRTSGYKVKMITAAYVILLLMGIAIAWDSLGQYLSSLLEVESSTRGVDSNGSGRLEAWTSGLALISSSPLKLAFGGGFRTAGYEEIGFFLESSYLNLAFEIGLIGLVAVVWQYSKTALFMLSFKPSHGRMQLLFFFVGLIILYLLIQSLLNRYLLAIGNPFSPFVLMLVMRSAIEMERETENQRRLASAGIAPAH